MMPQFSTRRLASPRLRLLDLRATCSAWAKSPCLRRTRASSCHRRALRGASRIARSMEAAALSRRPADASARALSTRLETAFVLESGDGAEVGLGVLTQPAASTTLTATIDLGPRCIVGAIIPSTLQEVKTGRKPVQPKAM